MAKVKIHFKIGFQRLFRI